jgi:membrane protein EpsK
MMWPAIALLVSGLVGVASAVALSRLTALGTQAVAIGMVGAWTAKNAVFMPLYAARVLGVRPVVFFWTLLRVVTWTVALAICSAVLATRLSPDSWPTLLMVTIPLGVIYAVATYRLGLKAEERRLAISLVVGRAGVAS